MRHHEPVAPVVVPVIQATTRLQILLDRKAGMERMVADHFRACREDPARDRTVTNLSAALRKVKAEIAAARGAR